MPVAIVANMLVEGRVYCYAGNQVSINVLYWRMGAPVGAPTTADLAAALHAEAQNLYTAWLAGNSNFAKVSIQAFTGPPYPLPDYSTAVAAPGVPGTSRLPRQTAGVITKTTAFSGVQYRGRLYLPFPYYDALGAVDAPSAGQIASATAIGTLLCTPHTFVSGALQMPATPMLVHSQPKDGSPTPAPTPILGFRVSSLFGTQRRRGGFGRPNTLPG